MVQQILEPPIGAAAPRTSPPGAAEAAEVVVLDELLATLAEIDGTVRAEADPDAVRIELLDRLERVKAAAAAASLRVARAFCSSQTEAQRAAGVRRERLGRGIGDQIALACRLTPTQGQARLRLAAGLAQMPCAEALLAQGRVSEWIAAILVGETSHLTAHDRAEVDLRLCGSGDGGSPSIVGMGPRRVAARARGMADRLDPAAAVRRRANAAGDRRVSVRPAPDTMAYLTALLPVEQAVACYANLTRAADADKAGGDTRGRGQIMADALVQRVTGQASAAAVPVEIGLVMTPDTLIGASDRPARLADGTPIPAGVARGLATQPDAPTWLRRLFTDPVTGVVTDLDRARRRLYGGPERRLIGARDQACRQPGCDSQLMHLDHIRRSCEDGQTVVVNGQRLCPAHNQVRELPGWRHEVADLRPGHHTVLITTPTGHTYSSQAPPALPP